MAGFPDHTKTEITGGKNDRQTVLIGDVVADQLFAEDPSEPVQLTSAPIEGGEDVSEYAIDLPRTLILDCTFHDDEIENVGNNETDVDRSGASRLTWRAKKDIILGYKRNHTPVMVTTGYDNYPDMEIMDYKLDRGPGKEECWSIQLIFQQVTFISQEWSSVSLDRIPKGRQSDKLKDGERRGGGERDGGRESAEKADQETADKTTEGLRSDLDRLLDVLF
jgi:hypothetical protein